MGFNERNLNSKTADRELIDPDRERELDVTDGLTEKLENTNFNKNTLKSKSISKDKIAYKANTNSINNYRYQSNRFSFTLLFIYLN